MNGFGMGAPTAPTGQANMPVNSNAYGLMPNANYLYGRNTGGYFPGNQVAGIPGMTQQGWSQMLQGLGAQMGPAKQFAGYAGGLGQSLSGMAGGGGFNQDAWNAIDKTNTLDFFDNEHLQGAIDAAHRGTTEAFNRGVMPQLNRGLSASGPGAYSSDRAGIAEGLARGDLANTLSDTEANMRHAAYGQGLSAYLQNRGQQLGAAQSATGNLFGLSGALGNAYNLAALPGSIQTQLGQMMGGIGNQQQQQMQNQLDSGMGRWNYGRDLPQQQFGWYNQQMNPYVGPQGWGENVTEHQQGGYAPTGAGGIMGPALGAIGGAIGKFGKF